MSRTKRARAVIAAHDRAAASRNVDAVMQNVADDVVVIAPGTPLLEGKDAFRAFYESSLADACAPIHELAAAQEVWDVVVAHGVAKAKTEENGCPTRSQENFLILLKPDSNGEFKIWRVAMGVNPSAS